MGRPFASTPSPRRSRPRPARPRTARRRADPGRGGAAPRDCGRRSATSIGHLHATPRVRSSVARCLDSGSAFSTDPESHGGWRRTQYANPNRRSSTLPHRSIPSGHDPSRCQGLAVEVTNSAHPKGRGHGNKGAEDSRIRPLSRAHAAGSGVPWSYDGRPAKRVEGLNPLAGSNPYLRPDQAVRRVSDRGWRCVPGTLVSLLVHPSRGVCRRQQSLLHLPEFSWVTCGHRAALVVLDQPMLAITVRSSTPEDQERHRTPLPCAGHRVALPHERVCNGNGVSGGLHQ